ncbi:unnamed protein product [Diamesa hyperborea]
MDLPTIPEFYKDQEIFVSGGSGFMGKVLIEKLLRSCPDIKKIYVLLRPKKGKSIEERLEILKKLLLFEPLKLTNPSAFDKLVPIAGDVTLLGLGLSASDVILMENVSIIFHSAASVRFDDPLKDAVLMNTRGTREMIKFAENLKNIKVMMHVSTTYCNTDRPVIEEQIYPAHANWKDAIKIAESVDEDLFNILTPKYSSFTPNTYTFTKSMAEQVVNDYKGKVPLVIFRPSIVVSAMKEPLPGWVDNFNGPVGLLVGCGVGIMRTAQVAPKYIADFTPVDVCIKAMIIAAWKRAYQEKGSLTVYNCCTSNQRNATMEQIIDMGKVLTKEIPLDKMIWAPGGGVTTSRLLNYIKVIFLQLIPAIFLDQILKFTGKKPFLTKLQRKIFEANCALRYFILNTWHFKNKNFMTLGSEIKQEDSKDFYFRDFIEFDILLYFRNCILGSRRYLLDEKDENIPKARKNYKRMRMLDNTVKGLIAFTFFYQIFIKHDVIHVSKEYFGNFATELLRENNTLFNM